MFLKIRMEIVSFLFLKKRINLYLYTRISCNCRNLLYTKLDYSASSFVNGKSNANAFHQLGWKCAIFNPKIFFESQIDIVILIILYYLIIFLFFWISSNHSIINIFFSFNFKNITNLSIIIFTNSISLKNFWQIKCFFTITID